MDYRIGGEIINTRKPLLCALEYSSLRVDRHPIHQQLKNIRPGRQIKLNIDRVSNNEYNEWLGFKYVVVVYMEYLQTEKNKMM